MKLYGSAHSHQAGLGMKEQNESKQLFELKAKMLEIKVDVSYLRGYMRSATSMPGQ